MFQLLVIYIAAMYICDNSFRGSPLWNNLTLRLKNSQTIDDFKFELKNLGKINCTCAERLFLYFYLL